MKDPMYRLVCVALLSLSCGFIHPGTNTDRIRHETYLARYAGVVPVDSLVIWNPKAIPRRFNYLKDTILIQTWIAWSDERVCIIPDWMVRYIERGDRPQCIWYSPQGV